MTGSRPRRARCRTLTSDVSRRAARARRGAAAGRARASATALADLIGEPEAFVAALRDRPAGARGRGLRARRRNASRPAPARPSASAGRSSTPSSARSAPRSASPRRTWLLLARPAPGRGARARGPPVRAAVPPRHAAGDPERSLAADAPAGAWRQRLDQRRRARGGLRPGGPRRALPVGGAGAAGLLRPAHGTPARRLHARPHPARGAAVTARVPGRRRSRWRSSTSSWATRTTRSRRRSRGRCGSGAAWTARRSGRGSTSSRCSRPRPATATAPGSSVTPCRRSRPAGRRRPSATGWPACAKRAGRPIHEPRRAAIAQEFGAGGDGRPGRRTAG